MRNLRDKVVDKFKSRLSYKITCQALIVSQHTVQSIMQKLKEYETTENQPRQGHPPKLKGRAKGASIRKTVKRHKWEHVLMGQDICFLWYTDTTKGIAERKSWDVHMFALCHKPTNMWMKLVWSQKTKHKLLWRKTNPADQGEHSIHVKHGGGCTKQDNEMKI